MVDEAQQSADQSVFPLTDYIKLELLSERTKANQFLKKFRRLSDDNAFDKARRNTFFIDFVGEVINLYNDLRDAIYAWKGSKKLSEEEIKELKAIDKDCEKPNYKERAKWIKRFQLLNKFLYWQGLTRLAIDVEHRQTEFEA